MKLIEGVHIHSAVLEARKHRSNPASVGSSQVVCQVKRTFVLPYVVCYDVDDMP